MTIESEPDYSPGHDKSQAEGKGVFAVPAIGVIIIGSISAIYLLTGNFPRISDVDSRNDGLYARVFRHDKWVLERDRWRLIEKRKETLLAELKAKEQHEQEMIKKGEWWEIPKTEARWSYVTGREDSVVELNDGTCVAPKSTMISPNGPTGYEYQELENCPEDTEQVGHIVTQTGDIIRWKKSPQDQNGHRSVSCEKLVSVSNSGEQDEDYWVDITCPVKITTPSATVPRTEEKRKKVNPDKITVSGDALEYLKDAFEYAEYRVLAGHDSIGGGITPETWKQDLKTIRDSVPSSYNRITHFLGIK